MCGILLEYGKAIPNELRDSSNIDELYGTCSSIFDQLVPKIQARGPDHSQYKVHDNICFFSSVLSLRSPFTAQPLSDSQYVIQFNGELYNPEIAGNDTVYIQSLLTSHTIEDTFRLSDGEFALIVYDKVTRDIYFGRDPVGKRSLVYRMNDQGLIISSVNPLDEREEFTDCVNGVIYHYNLDQHSLKTIPNNVMNTVNGRADPEMEHLHDRLDKLNEVLTESVEERIKTIQPLHIVGDHDALYSILFSGGLDCTVVAALCASLSKQDTTIDLLNVGFDNPRTGLKAKNAPDRVLALETWKSLCLKYPKINFNLVQIDVPYEEYIEHRPKVIELMYPKNTEMDLSISIALYFASRGKGELLRYRDTEIVNHGGYKSRAKVLLSGLGADELYGGYHKFNNKDLETLGPELERQINNIHERNLQRDDKVISDNGVEVRYPFLSQKVIDFSTSGIEINYKVSKYILRQLAVHIGLEFVAEEPKRAIQFGAKSAKMTHEGKKKGTDSLMI
jgi:asparagine synthetase B (glutamine-hydrolysing)